jgi:hypothetical protein
VNKTKPENYEVEKKEKKSPQLDENGNNNNNNDDKDDDEVIESEEEDSYKEIEYEFENNPELDFNNSVDRSYMTHRHNAQFLGIR